MFSRKSANRFIGGALLGYALYRAWEFYAEREYRKGLAQAQLAEDTPALVSDLEIMRWMGSLHFENDKDFVGALNEDIPNPEGPF